VSLILTARTFVVVLLILPGAAVASWLFSAESAGGAAFRVVMAGLAIGVTPGALLTLLWRPRSPLTVLEVIGFGIALSFGTVHLLTIAAVAIHASPAAIMSTLAVASLVVGCLAMWKGTGSVVLTVDDLVVAAAVMLIGVPLYLQGSPFDAYEDQVLVSIVRRLSVLETPRLDNLFPTPGVVYTYPFPGALYFMSLVTRVADVDAMFVYHKLRFFWGPAALVLLNLAARAVFGYASVATAVTLTGAILVATGTFAMVDGFPSWWGQLTPYSYVPDVAMTVLLPALLVMAFGYVVATAARERGFFLAGSVMLILMLTIIHIREVVQFAAYIGCFLVVGMCVRTFRPYARRAAVLLAVTVVMAGIYTSWQGRMVPVTTGVVAEERSNLLAIASALPFSDLITAPAAESLGDFVQDFDQIFAGLVPFLLFAGVIVVAAFRERPLVWLLSASTLAYLLVMTVPLLAIPYIYLTYFEILQIPVRNIIFFLYLFAGALAYLVVVTVARFDRTNLSAFVAGVLLGLVALLATLTANHTTAGFLVPAIAAYTAALLYVRPMTTRASLRTAAAGLLAVIALVGLWPDRQPVTRSDQVTIRWTTALSDERRAELEKQFSLLNAEKKTDSAPDENVWNYRLQDVSTGNVRNIVSNEDIVDTHFIDRSSFTVERQPPPQDHPAFGVMHAAWLHYPGLFLIAMTTVAVWALAFVVPAVIASGWWSLPTTSLGRPFYKFAAPYVLFIVPFALWPARMTLSPFALSPMAPAGRAATPRALVEQTPCVTMPSVPARFAEEDVVVPARTTCPPDYAVMQWVAQNVPVESVFAVDRWTPYPPTVFMPQQAVVFPTLDASFIHEDSLFRDYYRLFGDRMKRYRVQPFFNQVETPADRDEFVRDLGVTHILVSPVHYDELRPVLDALPNQFSRRYDRSRWAVYEVIRNIS
jgi:hypothetical protein